jgi:hypothetical protein
MATGRLGTANVTTAAQLTTVYTVPANTFTLCSISVCNRGNTDCGIRVALAAGSSPTDDEWIEYNVDVGGHGVLERTGVLLSAGQKIIVWTGAPNVSVVVYGVETSTL